MSWYRAIEPNIAKPETRQDLYKLLDVETALYGKHVDWFMKHRETVLKQLAVLLTAELVIARFSTEPPISPWANITILLFLAFLSPILAHAGVRSCYRSFKASLEHSMFINKLIWAISPATCGKQSESKVNAQNIPVNQDETLQVPRFAKGAAEFPTTEQYTDYHLGVGQIIHRRSRNTCFWASMTIWTLGILGLIIGVACAIAMGMKTL